MTGSGIQLLAQLVAERAVNSIPGGLLIAGFAWLMLRVMRKQNSGTRFAVWFSALVAIAGLSLVPALSSPSAVPRAMRPEIMLPRFWAVAIFAVWIFIAALAATRVVVGLRNLRRLRRTGREIAASELPPELREMLAQCKVVRSVTVRSSSEVTVPTAIGFFKPVILIPEWALQDLPAGELKIVLLHEFAHLRRWDDWTNLTQKIIRSAFFFHPAVWWIERRLSLEREMACDDAVLAKTENPRAYAECLVSLAEKSVVQRGLAMAQAAINHACETSIRLAQILDANRPPSTRVFKPALGVMTAVAGVCFVMLPDAPRLIAFKNGVQPATFTAAIDAAPRLTQAAVVPVTAMASTDSTGATRVQIVPTPAMYRSSRRAARLTRSRFNEAVEAGRGSYARAVAVYAPAPAQRSIAARQFLVVLQTTEYDGQGSAILNVCVWRVTFTRSDRNPVQRGVAGESI